MPPPLRLELLGQTPADLVEDQAHKRLGAADVRRRHDQIERGRRGALHQVANAPVALARHRGYHRIPVETEEGHRGRQDARAFVVALVQELAGRAGDDRMDAAFTEVCRRHHRSQCRLDRATRIGKEVGDAGERLVGLRIEHVQDRADQQRMARLLPVVPTLQRALGVDEDVSDVLDVADFPLAPSDLEQRIVGSARRVGRIEQQHAAEPRPPARGKRPVFALDVVDDRGAGPD